MSHVDLGVLFRAAVDLLVSAEVDYMTIGGLVAGVWGDPRNTKDADFIVALGPNQTGPFLRRARDSGFEFDEQVALMNLEISGVTRLFLGGRFIDLVVGETEFDLAALARKRTIRLFDRDAFVSSPEDLILYKLVALRDRDVDDVRRVMIRQSHSLDVPHLRKWADVLAEKAQRPLITSRLEELLAERGLG